MPDFTTLRRGEASFSYYEHWEADKLQFQIVFDGLGLKSDGFIDPRRSGRPELWRWMRAARLRADGQRWRSKTTQWSHVACIHAYRELYIKLRFLGLRPDEMKLLNGESEDAQMKELEDLEGRTCACKSDWVVSMEADLKQYEAQLGKGEVREHQWRTNADRVRLPQLVDAHPLPEPDSGGGEKVIPPSRLVLGYRFFGIKTWPEGPITGPFKQNAYPWGPGIVHAECEENLSSYSQQRMSIPTPQDLLLYGRRRLQVPQKPDSIPNPMVFTDVETTKMMKRREQCVSHLREKRGNCGWWSFHSPAEVEAQYVKGKEAEATGWVLAQVALGGTVWNWSIGRRSSQARIEALWLVRSFARNNLHGKEDRSNNQVQEYDIAYATMLGTLYDCHVGILVGPEWLKFRAEHGLLITP